MPYGIARKVVVSWLQEPVFKSHWGEFTRGVERMAETREVMDIREASEYLGVSRETLYKYVDAEKIPAFKLGNRWKFKKTLLDRWMETQSAQFRRRSVRRPRVPLDR
jgi:excisionase family DNA binding protein